MNDKTIELKYTLNKKDALSAYELTGKKKERNEKNRNTTICFAVVIALFLYNLITALLREKTDMTNNLIYTSIIFIIISVIFIFITWMGGKSVFKTSVNNIIDIEFKVFINENGISYIFGDSNEEAINKTDFTVKQSDEIYLITSSGRSLIIPKRAIKSDDSETVKYLLKK